MKRLFSCFLVCLLLIFSFPVVVSATETVYKVENINDMILIRYKDDIEPYNGRWWLYGRSVSPHQVFMYRVLLLAGYEFENLFETLSDLDSWEKSAESVFGQVFWDSISALFDSYIFYNFDSTKLVFSSDFCFFVSQCIELWNDQNDTVLENPLVYVFSFDSVKWSSDDCVYTCFLYDDDSRIEVGGYSIDDFYLDLSSEYSKTDSLSFYEFWLTLRDSIDINVLTSWLPDVLSSPIKIYWAIFLSAVGILVVVKILH